MVRFRTYKKKNKREMRVTKRNPIKGDEYVKNTR